MEWSENSGGSFITIFLHHACIAPHRTPAQARSCKKAELLPQASLLDSQFEVKLSPCSTGSQNKNRRPFFGLCYESMTRCCRTAVQLVWSPSWPSIVKDRLNRSRAYTLQYWHCSCDPGVSVPPWTSDFMSDEYARVRNLSLACLPYETWSMS